MRSLTRTLFLALVLVAPALAAQNLLQNADFNCDLSSWTLDPSITIGWQAFDSEGVPSSGSARLVNSVAGGYGGGVYQCVAVTGGTMYELGSRAFLAASDVITGSAEGGINAAWYSSTNCDPTTRIGQGVGQAITHTGEWTQVIDFETAPSTARSAQLQLIAIKPSGGPNFEASFDHAFFGAGSPSAPGAVVTQFLPAVASIHGGANSFFHSDVWITNLSYQLSAPVNITYHCYAGQSCNSSPHSVTIGPRKTQAFTDIVGTFLASPETAGGLEVTYDPYFGPLAIASRLYTPSTQPTYGFSLEGRFLVNALIRGDFPGISGGGSSSSGFRSNIGFYNPNDTQANVTITVYDNSGVQLGTPINLSIAPHSALQVNGVFGAAGAPSATLVTDANAVFTSNVPLFGFASVLDNMSNDSSFLVATRDFSPKQ